MAPDRWSLDPTSQRVALSVLRRGPISRADIGRLLHLSSASVTRITQPLVRAGLLVEGEPLGHSTGRPALPLDVAADTASFVGVKVMHDHLHAVLTDLRGTIIATADRDGSGWTPHEVARAIADLVSELGNAGHRPGGLGVSLGGTVAADGLVRGTHLLAWDEPVDLAWILQQATGLATIIDNDVNAFTLAEHWFGVGRDTEDFAVLTIGAGVGLGLVCGDEVVRGHGGAAGMVGPLPVLGVRTASEVLTTRALEADAAALLGRPVGLDEVTGLTASDERIASLLDDVADAVGRLVGIVASVTCPERVLVAGEGASVLTGREDRIRVQAELMRSPGADDPEIVVEAVGNDEWARGAAALAIRSRMGAV